MRARTGVPALHRTRTQEANDRFFLYEICDSRAALGTHLPSPHLATFNTTSADLVMNENVAKLDLIFEGSNNRR
jgi:quinol monooxygenase YgiN